MIDSASDSLRRVLQLIPELADDKEHKLDDVAARVGVDRSRVLKDLNSLADRLDDPGGFVEGVQIYFGNKTVRLYTDHFRRPMRLTVAELAALELGMALLAAERAPEEAAAIDRARIRLRKVLSQTPDEAPPIDYRVASVGVERDTETLQAVRGAIRDRHRITIRYRSSTATTTSERVVCPYACIFATGAWYMVAQCEPTEGLRVFRLDRIESVTRTEEKYEIPAEFSVDSVVRDGRVFVGQPAEEVTIWYGPAVARWVAEREGKALDPDGSVTLTYPLADTQWAVRHVLQYAPEARVLTPESARIAVRQALQRITSGARP